MTTTTEHFMKIFQNLSSSESQRRNKPLKSSEIINKIKSLIVMSAQKRNLFMDFVSSDDDYEVAMELEPEPLYFSEQEIEDVPRPEQVKRRRRSPPHHIQDLEDGPRPGPAAVIVPNVVPPVPVHEHHDQQPHQHQHGEEEEEEEAVVVHNEVAVFPDDIEHHDQEQQHNHPVGDQHIGHIQLDPGNYIHYYIFLYLYLTKTKCIISVLIHFILNINNIFFSRRLQ